MALMARKLVAQSEGPVFNLWYQLSSSPHMIKVKLKAQFDMSADKHMAQS